MRDRGSEDGFLAALPDAVPDVGTGLHGLCRPVPGSCPFQLDGRRAWGSSEGEEAGVTLSLGGGADVTVMEARRGTPVNTLAFPGVVRREFAGPSGTRLKTVVIAPALPLGVIQWSGSEGSPVELTLRLPEAAKIVERSSAGVVAEATGGRLLVVGCVPAAKRIELIEEHDGGPLMTVRTDSPFALVAAAGAPQKIRTTLAAAGHLPAHALRAASIDDSEGLHLETGVAEIDDGVAWATSRLRGAIARARGTPPDPRMAALMGLAASAIGDRESARCMVGAVGRGHPVVAALLAARFASTFGEAGPAAERGRLLLDAARSDEPTPSGSALADDEPELHALALDALADALQHAAAPKMLSDLRARAGEIRATTGRSTGAGGSLGSPGQAQGSAGTSDTRSGRSLPMAGGTPHGPDGPRPFGAWLADVVAGGPSSPTPPARRDGVARIRTAGAEFASDPDGAWSTWRESLAGGVEGREFGPGTWDPPGSSDNESLAAELLLSLTHGLLGISRDAPVGRLRLAPRLPRHLATFGFGCLRLGDTTLRMGYERRGITHAFLLEPERASVPPLVVFEPTVHGSVVAIRVDGAPAELDIRAEGGRTIVPVQLPLDGIRTVEIDTR